MSTTRLIDRIKGFLIGESDVEKKKVKRSHSGQLKSSSVNLVKREIYISLTGLHREKFNEIGAQTHSSLKIDNVGYIEFYEPLDADLGNVSEDTQKKSYKATFTYFDNYCGPVLDPINLNYLTGQRKFSIPPCLKNEGLFRVFSDCLPSGCGRQRLHKEFPETEKFCDLKLLNWLSAGGGRREQVSDIGFASGAMLFFTKKPGDERVHNSLEKIGEFRAKCVADLAGYLVKMTDQELSASWVHGGAQFKTTYCDEMGEVGPKGVHYIVKFSDLGGISNARIEHGSLLVATAAGIRSAKSIVVRIVSNGVFVADILLIERYDRYTDDSGCDNRRHRLSLLSLMDPVKVPRQDSGDYVDIFSAIRRVSANPDADCEEMFRRLLLNIGLNNTDDHLKNHEFIYDSETQNWLLSPAYDINPNTYLYKHATSIAGFSNGALTKEFVLLIAERLKIDQKFAIQSLEQVSKTLCNWKRIYSSAGCSKEDLQLIEVAVQNQGILAQRNYGFTKDGLSVSNPTLFKSPAPKIENPTMHR